MEALILIGIILLIANEFKKNKERQKEWKVNPPQGGGGGPSGPRPKIK